MIVNVKKLVGFMLVFMLTFSLIIPSNVSAESKYTVYVNGKQLESKYDPIVYNDAVYVPLWSLLGQLNMSAEPYGDILRINHPYRILLIRADQNMMTYYGRDMGVHYARLDYPIITQNYVMYVPLVFLGDYLDMQVAYNDDGRIDITASDFSKGVSWGKENIIKSGVNELRLNSDAEAFWKQNSTLWNKSRFVGGAVTTLKYDPFTVIGYSGSTVTLVGSENKITTTFKSMQEIKDTFYTYDPLAGTGWSEGDKDRIKHSKIRIGMTKSMTVLSWGIPTDINKYATKYSYTEQWVYRYSLNGSTDYVYFDETDKITSISTN